jgi:hypothetical protein
MQAALCNAVVRLKLELYRLPKATPSAIVLDGYNALFWRTDMFEASSLKDPLRRIDAQELTLGANMRVLSDVSIGSTVVVGAICLSGDVPDLPLALSSEAPYTKYTLPLLSISELGSMLVYYRCDHAVCWCVA